MIESRTRARPGSFGSVATTADESARAGGWLRSPSFDLLFIGGALALALGMGAIASASPALFGWVLALDLWLLAYPHVTSTFSRFALDAASRRRHRALLVVLPPLVLLATAASAWLGGALVLNSVYYYWQSYHYTKQSYGIARAYDRARRSARPDELSGVVVFAFSIWGVVHRAVQGQQTFYGGPLYVPALPKPLELVAGAVAAAALAAWTLRWVRSEDASSRLGHALYLLSHVVVTVVSYVAIRDVTHGWLVINVWHNAQYLLYVWSRNAADEGRERAAAGASAPRPWLESIRAPERVAAYIGVCLAASTAFYLTLGHVAAALSWAAFPLVLVCHQAVNFHHYLVDARIWRRAA